MRRRALLMVFQSVLVSLTLLGLPLAILAPSYVWQSSQTAQDNQAVTLSRYLDQIGVHDLDRTRQAVTQWRRVYAPESQIRIDQREKRIFDSGSVDTEWQLYSHARSAGGLYVSIRSSAVPVIWSSVGAVCAVLICGAVALGAGTIFAFRGSRRLAAPLIYLSAQAEQVGSGAVQARIEPTGIEEIDLVSEELSRSGERIVGRIAKERQFASDVTHQLRTPLTALSMRIEEIQYLSDDEEVRTEAEACLEQVERITQVVEDLKKRAQQSSHGHTQAVKMEEIFRQQRDEWEPQFTAVGRRIVFDNQVTDRLPLATPSSLSQAIATLVENSLKYGAGTVTVSTREGVSSRSIFVEVSDEGEGVSEDIAPDIFRRGVSGHGSSGIGLALAKDLIEADGGRIELTNRQPAVFTISLAAVSESMSPDRLLPQGGLVVVGRRHGRH
ncbi:sensor histidine kinase [Varibaculum prostatecancerukia]|uniref:sensor histidine kinase n=1 Tax=Varibaculum prostatecancerukia TaxID=2811781 RepID=UPI00203ACA8F|nr:HAMP domain-containing sensor histidine kinase [Varibaculum prostatecancerukia]